MATAMIKPIRFFSTRASCRSKYFEQSRGAHAAADAHRHHRELRAAPLAFDERVPGKPRPGHAVRMADRDRTAIHVEPVVGNAELVAAVDDLDRERLVELPQVDIGDLLAGALE